MFLEPRSERTSARIALKLACEGRDSCPQAVLIVGSAALSIFIGTTSAEQVIAADVYCDYRGCGDG